MAFHVKAPFAQGRLIRDFSRERVSESRQIVCHEAQSGIARFRLDDHGPSRHLSLSAQRLELAAKFGRQVGQPGEIALHSLQLAERLFFALAMLEDSGGLLDKAPTILGRGVQDRIELTLAHDDVHFPADARIRQEFLNIKQSAGRAINGVLGSTIAKERPGDRDLGVIDGERTIGVVNGESHFSPTQGCSTRRAGEDDVRHVAASQGLGPLLAHDPGERIHDVGLARAVGTYDARNAGLKGQRRRGGK